MILHFNEICMFISQNESSVVSEASFSPTFLESAWTAFFAAMIWKLKLFKCYILTSQ